MDHTGGSLTPSMNHSRVSSLDPSAQPDYARGMELPNLQDDPYLKLLRPLVESYQAFWIASCRHIRTLRLTPSQFDVLATLGDTTGMTCTELSAATLVTKGTLTGVLDRLESKGLIRRETDPDDRRRVNVRLTDKGDEAFRASFGAHIAFLRPFFQRAMTDHEIDQTRRLLLRLRDSFQQGSQ